MDNSEILEELENLRNDISSIKKEISSQWESLCFTEIQLEKLIYRMKNDNHKINTGE
jgi:hypothetical protein